MVFVPKICFHRKIKPEGGAVGVQSRVDALDVTLEGVPIDTQ